MDSRRVFLARLLTIGATAGGGGRILAWGQNPPLIPPAPKPGEEPPAENPAGPSSSAGEKKILEENEKDIKKKVERLYELATQLKTEVDKTDSSKVLSLNLVKKAEEIERLARDIKNRSKG